MIIKIDGKAVGCAFVVFVIIALFAFIIWSVIHDEEERKHSEKARDELGEQYLQEAIKLRNLK